MNKLSSATAPSLSPEGAVRKMSKAGPLAARLGLHKKTLFRWADARLVHRYKINARVVLFDETEVSAFIDSARVGERTGGPAS